MTDFCKCAHEFKDHSHVRWYQRKSCTLCDCREYLGRDNKWHMLSFLFLMGTVIVAISMLSVGIFIIIDAFNSLPDPSIDSQLSIQSVFNLVIVMAVGGLVIGGIIVIFFMNAMNERSRYLRPIKPL